VLLIRRIRDLLYEQGFTISGARHRLDEVAEVAVEVNSTQEVTSPLVESKAIASESFDFTAVKSELMEILNLLRSTPKLAI
jgi:hypothetical protein